MTREKKKTIGCPGTHAAAVQEGHLRIKWYRPTRRAARIRVRAHTCGECRTTMYEFCSAGGLTFIRRTGKPPDGRVHESEWLVAPEGLSLWRRLLLGRAR